MSWDGCRHPLDSRGTVQAFGPPVLPPRPALPFRGTAQPQLPGREALSPSGISLVTLTFLS